MSRWNHRHYLGVGVAAIVAVCLFQGTGIEPGTGNGAPAPEIALHFGRSDKEQILDTVLSDILTNPELKSSREWYGTPGDKRVALVSNDEYGVPWPKGYRPAIEGYVFLRVSERSITSGGPHILGVRVNKYFNEDPRSADLFRSRPPVLVSIFNAGGDQNGAIIGACSVDYTPKRVDGRWVVELEGMEAQ